MKDGIKSKVSEQTVAIVAPFPLPYGGMAIQAEKLYKRLTESGVTSFCIKSNISFPRFLRYFEKVRGIRTIIRFIIFSIKLLHIKQATVVHLFGASHAYFFLVVTPAIFVANLMNKKLILNYRGGEAEEFFKKWKLLTIPLLKKTDVIAVPSDFLKGILEKAAGREVLILPNVVDIDIFRYKERSKLKPIIVVSRQLEPRYNVACALRAFKIIKKAYPAAQLKIAGTGSEEKRIKKLKEEMLLKDVDLLGDLTHDELFYIYDKCDVMINPSNIDNFPGSIMEAFACGLPVVTTKVGGIHFMVKEGETGIMVKPNDHEGLAEGVITLLRNPMLAKLFSANGRKVAEEYSWEKVKKVLLSMYELT